MDVMSSSLEEKKAFGTTTRLNLMVSLLKLSYSQNNDKLKQNQFKHNTYKPSTKQRKRT
jgi:hypothetical protein